MANCMEKEEEDTVQNNVDKGCGEKKENIEVDIFGAEKESSEDRRKIMLKKSGMLKKTGH